MAETQAAKKNKGLNASRVRMIDIAREAGVSQPTVSYVLNGGKMCSRISGETANKIRRIAKRLKFHPNHAARQLAGKRSGIIGVLAKTFWDTEQRTMGWLNQLASTQNLKMLAWQMDAHPEALEAFVDECIGWNVDGLVYIAFKYDSVWPLVAKALTRLPRVVSVLGDPGIPGGYAVDFDAADGVRQCVEHLHRQGRRRIVQVLEELDVQIDRRRHEAFLAAHREFYGAADGIRSALRRRGGASRIMRNTRNWPECWSSTAAPTPFSPIATSARRDSFAG